MNETNNPYGSSLKRVRLPLTASEPRQAGRYDPAFFMSEPPTGAYSQALRVAPQPTVNRDFGDESDALDWLEAVEPDPESDLDFPLLTAKGAAKYDQKLSLNERPR